MYIYILCIYIYIHINALVRGPATCAHALQPVDQLALHELGVEAGLSILIHTNSITNT